MRQSENLDNAIFYYHISLIFPLPLFFLLHFCLVYSEKYSIRNKLRFNFLLYSPAFILLLFNFISINFGDIPIKTYYGWKYPEPGLTFPSNLLLIIFITILGIFLYSTYLFLWTNLNSSSNSKINKLNLV